MFPQLQFSSIRSSVRVNFIVIFASHPLGCNLHAHESKSDQTKLQTMKYGVKTIVQFVAIVFTCNKVL